MNCITNSELFGFVLICLFSVCVIKNAPPSHTQHKYYETRNTVFLFTRCQYTLMCGTRIICTISKIVNVFNNIILVLFFFFTIHLSIFYILSSFQTDMLFSLCFFIFFFYFLHLQFKVIRQWIAIF